MFFSAFLAWLFGFGVLLFDALLRSSYSLVLAGAGGVLIALSMIFLIAGILTEERIHQESPDSLP